ncbi:shikimate kinase [Alkalibacter rhizosphaerae]|uniref:Shikimate kinase n=1 Tax=Alkalibacter rhizosphaerae TaxID=2815577 RepID=A0A974XF07_9FIRM|nr:shikimate kinase [Alkalibacter rhizosphaerae]QSX08642.1 shikimate kinase [Alkalibacter rhizosphaerae]
MSRNNISLIGFMGTGKTTIGRNLAKALNYEFVDVDRFIEEQEGMTISQIFSCWGETYFRQLETKALKEILQKEKQVISTGGGIVIKEENRQLLMEHSFVVALKATPRNLYFRLKESTTRPLIQGPHPERTIRHMMHRRYPYYNQNHFSVETDRHNVADSVSLIMENYMEKRSAL